MDTTFLNKFITNKQLIQLIDKIVNCQSVYVIKKKYYKTTDFTKRIYLNTNDIDPLHIYRYQNINVQECFIKTPSRKDAVTTLSQHSIRVLEETKAILDSMPNLYKALDVYEYDNLYEKESAKEEFRNIALAGAFLHDIGKALFGVKNTKIDDHSYVGGNYMYKFKNEFMKIYETFRFKEALFEKLDNIIRWHMGFVLDTHTKSYIAERRPDVTKHIETYIVSLADWKVNTAHNKRQKMIVQEIKELKEIIKNEDYKIITDQYGMLIENDKFSLAIH